MAGIAAANTVWAVAHGMHVGWLVANAVALIGWLVVGVTEQRGD